MPLRSIGTPCTVLLAAALIGCGESNEDVVCEDVQALVMQFAGAIYPGAGNPDNLENEIYLREQQAAAIQDNPECFTPAEVRDGEPSIARIQQYVEEQNGY